MALRFAYCTNGQGLYAVDMKTAKEGDGAKYPTPDELWDMTFSEANALHAARAVLRHST